MNKYGFAALSLFLSCIKPISPAYFTNIFLMMKKIVTLLLLWLSCLLLSAQSSYKYWVQFTDKNDTTYKLSKPHEFLTSKAILRRSKQKLAIDSTDLPIKKAYIDSVLAKGVNLHTSSKWFNGITISVTDTTLMSTIRQLPFVRKTEKTFVPNLNRSAKLDSKKLNTRSVAVSNNGYGNAFAQINMHNGEWLHQAGFKGEGMQIAVLDAGFLNINTNPAMATARNNGQILGTHDFVNPQSDIYSENFHGAQVLSIMAANDYDKYIGTAPDASYLLVRTEDAGSEFPVEMDNMIAGMEYADSMGVDIITASLGYFNFDDSTMNLDYNKLNGNTYRVSRGLTLCARKGMLVVSSAGNQGNLPWHYIIAPTDADSILTVGSVTSALKHSAFSSWGPTADGRTKPSVCALGSNTAVVTELGAISTGNGTSLATPIIAGLAACLWQALPSLSNMEIIELIKKHGSKFGSPDNELGYGIPDFYAAYVDAVGTTKSLLNSVDLVQAYPNPVHDSMTVDIDPSIMGRNPELIIYNMNGKKVLKHKLYDTSTLFSLSDLTQGNYSLVIKLGNLTIFRQNFIKQ